MNNKQITIYVNKETALSTVNDLVNVIDNMKSSIKVFDNTMKTFFESGYSTPESNKYQSQITDLINNFEPLYNVIQNFANLINNNATTLVEADQSGTIGQVIPIE